MDSCRPGSNVCLICIASIKHVDAVWSCGQCYCIFHLQCIQKWSRDGAVQNSTLSQENFPAVEATWCCPKCRYEFKQSDCPTRYHCFCGKEENPAFDPWIVPHSCGQTCSRPLKPDCGHECLLLCHPGPCPPCPKTVRTRCHCGTQAPSVRRCGAKDWSCSRPCGKLLSCGHHSCQTPCHAGDCPPCPKESVQSCLCGKQESKRPCASPDWQCQKICGRTLSCGFHICEKVCHSGLCGDCPRSGERSCPCGKTKISLPCTEDIPTCGDTCEQELSCGRHKCTQRCHQGPCGPCRQFVTKQCRCGKREKNVQCSMEFTCEAKCTNMRQCSRHQCKRKCCDGKCPPCEQTCGRTLNCKNHKCPSQCHRGPCYPCPLTVDMKCFCGSTVVTLQCGREKISKPPKCNELCKHPSNCHHPSREPHRCHYGDCPTCRQICKRHLPDCNHTCPQRCHDNVPAQTKSPIAAAKDTQQNPEVVALPCPPCREPVKWSCYGEHEDRLFPCSEACRYSCGRPCGRALPCGNHTCQLECHYVTKETSKTEAGPECQACEEPCNKPRPSGCTHSCPRPCHQGECHQCKLMLKRQCHCCLMAVYIRCSDWTSSEGVAREQLQSCKNQCPKTLSCGHRCGVECHPGACPDTLVCSKKTAVRCPCRRKKMQFPCYRVQSNDVKVECDDECKAAKRRQEEENAAAHRRTREEQERAQKAEIALYERLRGGKKRRQRKQEEFVEEPMWISAHKNELILSAVAMAIVAGLFYIAMS
ncbi:NF-X1-type zinc finger protein NFXL1 isoform X2 [Nematostella vectensis]|nr:NF-X1-type zinc finger protein NFXL1 isoform X2 [Nematostella vectensis]